MTRLPRAILGGFLLMVSVFAHACPELQGSYKIEGQTDLYIQKQSDSSYLAMVESANRQPNFMPVIVPEKEQLREESFPECTVIIKGAGLLMPSDKNKTYSVSSESQNYLTEKKPGTPFVIMYMAGFQSDVFGVEKISDDIPSSIVDIYLKAGGH
ncbi:hypothetical protein SOASR030_23180 [Leminorella grimontii]|uniref:Lipoprotein n=1 Tax=Leminorella grimontii TaxID=82981 RepID=A0AAV5N615_9GAMM|nr:hypothetical protein [Leminorella grimontii]GKX56206.1 hypothetical protein SOASR030_23180 [Leminorella grimontii]VFS60978.1 Uncharacterised protein [Leminorella grimontii]